jgi:hypothetical protein
MPRVAVKFACLVAMAVPCAAMLPACEDGPLVHGSPSPSDPTDYEISDVTIDAAARVLPGAALAVTVTAVNSGDAAWEPGDTRLLWSGDPMWGAADLALAELTEPGAEGTFTAMLTAPERVGIHDLAWQPAHGTSLFGGQVTAVTHVTCDDGVFCNGAERFADGACQPGLPPCDDGADCTTDTCDDATGWCGHELGAGCETCHAECVPDCNGKVCGDDGCGASCGACDAGQGCASVLGICQPADLPGTCANPIPLLEGAETLVGNHTIFGDTSAALHEVVPTCNTISTAVELVYKFDVTDPVSIDARSFGYDTVLHIRKENPGTPGNECLDDSPAVTVGCSDDASPPGDYGSRVAVTLDPGTYYLIVDGFDSTEFGMFQLDVKAVAGTCVPQCDGQYCGDDDLCGGDCGVCDQGFACVDSKCQPDPCIPQCDGKGCGDDGCGATCGECPAGQLCVPANSQCAAFAICDHNLPECDPPCGAGQFCGSDCACHGVTEPMPDLVINSQRLADEILFDQLYIDEKSCAVAEGCVSGTGMRKLLRFSVEAVNQGQALLAVQPPEERPDLFQFSGCHGHYHFNGFATYALLDEDGKEVLQGRKQAYCMEDTTQFHQGPNVACEKNYDCFNQGVQAGWSDVYGNALDCQWLDITDVPPGKYQIMVAVNPNRAFEEISVDNNTAAVDVTIP